MALRKVAVLGHPILRKIADPIAEKDISSPAIQKLLQDMAETMFEYDGRGLAAPQIHESLQIVTMLWDFNPKKDAHIIFLINPKIQALTTETSAFGEGCLSVPGLRGKVSRPNRVSVEYLNQNGQKQNWIAEGFAATVIQHECDHLIGKLYLDRLTSMEDLAFNREYQRYHENDPKNADEGS